MSWVFPNAGPVVCLASTVQRSREDKERLVADMIEQARQYGRCGYRRIAALLRDAGWQISDKRDTDHPVMKA